MTDPVVQGPLPGFLSYLVFTKETWIPGESKCLPGATENPAGFCRILLTCRTGLSIAALEEAAVLRLG